MSNDTAGAAPATTLPPLLPCPHCGSTESPRPEVGGMSWRVECRNCSACGPVESSEHAAIEQWNRRSSKAPDPQQAMRQALTALEAVRYKLAEGDLLSHAAITVNAAIERLTVELAAQPARAVPTLTPEQQALHGGITEQSAEFALARVAADAKAPHAESEGGETD